MFHSIVHFLANLVKRNPDNHHAAYIDRFFLEYGCTVLSFTDTDQTFIFEDPRPADDGIFDQRTDIKAVRFQTSGGMEQECLIALLKDVSTIPPTLHLRASMDLDPLLPARYMPWFVQAAEEELFAHGYQFHLLDPTRNTFDYRAGQQLSAVPVTAEAPEVYFKVARCMSPRGEFKDLLLAFVAGAPLGPQQHPRFAVYAATPL